MRRSAKMRSTRLIEMLKDLIKRAEQGQADSRALHRHRLPRRDPRGRLDRARRAESARQLGDKSFNLPRRLREAIPQIGDHDTVVVMHNDAVVQGLSELPFMQDVEHWGVLTIGTGLGNAHFTNRAAEKS